MKRPKSSQIRGAKFKDLPGLIFEARYESKRIKVLEVGGEMHALGDRRWLKAEHASGRETVMTVLSFVNKYVLATNGGVKCDVITGPCACKATH